jgi:hypothetical protein
MMDGQITQNSFGPAALRGVGALSIVFVLGGVVVLAPTMVCAQTSQAHHSQATARRHRAQHAVYIREVNPAWSHPYAAQPENPPIRNTSVSMSNTPAAAVHSRVAGAMSSTVITAALPSSATPAMTRITAMLQATEGRMHGAPPASARSMYQSAATSLRQALRMGRVTAMSPAAGAGNAAGLPISSMQIGDDIRALRSAAQSAHGAQSTVLNQIAGLYATGAKDYFTAEMRVALLGNTTPEGVAIPIRGRSTGTVSSAILPGAHRTEIPAPAGGVIQPDGTLVPVGSEPAPTNPGTPVPGPVVPFGVTPPLEGGVGGPAPIVVVPAVP